jgi:sugar (pentulose or hexulose) kinase
VLVYAVDVGTTNLKVVLYDDQLRRLGIASAPAVYARDGARVEFDPEQLFDTVLDLIGQGAGNCDDVARHEAVIAISAQAEALVINDRRGTPVRPGMSWLDDRAVAEAGELAERFGTDYAFAVTGEPYPSATWPAAKLRWLGRHEPGTLDSARSVLMIKDDLIRRFTGTAVGEITTRGFTYFWDVPNGTYWHEMLDFCSVPRNSLPDVVPAGTDVGQVSEDVVTRLPGASGYRVNVGALDHFCAMVGTGSYAEGIVSESAGTVLSLSLLDHEWTFDPERKVSFHSGLHRGDTVLFNGVDSGGAALEWFRRHGLAGMSYDELEQRLRSREYREPPIFLPYLTGVNPPDYFPDAKGAFLNLDLGHDHIDMAFAVEEGIAHLLRRNVEYLSPEPAHGMVSTGGGAASAFWNQLKADVCGVDVLVPDEHEATCRGAAVLALVASGKLNRLEDANQLHAPATVRYRPSRTEQRQARYRLFEDYLRRLYQS